jgi:hypothetical protein
VIPHFPVTSLQVERSVYAALLSSLRKGQASIDAVQQVRHGLTGSCFLPGLPDVTILVLINDDLSAIL